MSLNHVPFYLRNQEFEAHCQPKPYDRSKEEGSYFGEEMNESVVLEAEDLSIDIPKIKYLNPSHNSHTPDQHSEIIDSMSFASSSKLKQAARPLGPIVHYERGYRNRLELNRLKTQNYFNRQDSFDNTHKRAQEKIKQKLGEVRTMVESLRRYSLTVVKEIEMWQGRGNLAISIQNEQFARKLIDGFQQILGQHVRLAI